MPNLSGMPGMPDINLPDVPGVPGLDASAAAAAGANADGSSNNKGGSDSGMDNSKNGGASTTSAGDDKSGKSSGDSGDDDSKNKKKNKDADTTNLFAAPYFKNNSFGYALVEKGSCESNGFANIDGASDCSAAARNLKLPTYALQYVENGDPKTAKMAATCILKSTVKTFPYMRLQFDLAPKSLCSKTQPCICILKGDYPKKSKSCRSSPEFSRVACAQCAETRVGMCTVGTNFDLSKKIEGGDLVCLDDSVFGVSSVNPTSIVRGVRISLSHVTSEYQPLIQCTLEYRYSYLRVLKRNHFTLVCLSR